MAQVVELKRSDKVYIAGIKTTMRRINNEIRELNWLDKCIELIQNGKIKELRKLWVIER